jgi:hypothetical protein
MKVAADAHHVPFAAVIFPLFDFPIDESYPFKELHQHIADFLVSRGIPTLDMQKVFSGLNVTRLQLIPGRDSHPNERAHRIAAEAIDEWMRTQKALPEEVFTSQAASHRDDVRDVRVTAPTNTLVGVS